MQNDNDPLAKFGLDAIDLRWTMKDIAGKRWHMSNQAHVTKLIELGLVVFSLVDLFKPERRVIGDNKLVWALVIILVGTIGPIVYLLAGRKQS